MRNGSLSKPSTVTEYTPISAVSIPPRQTRMWVRIPAWLPCLPRSMPIMPPKSTAIITRTPTVIRFSSRSYSIRLFKNSVISVTSPTVYADYSTSVRLCQRGADSASLSTQNASILVGFCERQRGFYEKTFFIKKVFSRTFQKIFRQKFL